MTGVVVFLLGVYASTWALSLTLGRAAGAGSAASVWIFLLGTVWAPTVIALLVVRYVEHDSVPTFLRERIRVPRSRRWLVVAAAAPALIVLAAVAASRALGHSAPIAVLSSWPVIIGLRVVTGATGEELGWRGFLVSRLTARFGFATAAVTSGVLWSAWHIAGIVFPHSGLDIAPRVPVLLFIGLFGVFLALIFARTGGSALATMLAHLSLNVTLGLGGTSLDAGPLWWTLTLGMAIVVVSIALGAGRLTLHAPEKRASDGARSARAL